MIRKKRIFISFSESDYSRSGVIFERNSSTDVFLKISAKPQVVIRQVRNLKRKYSVTDVVIVVMSPSHILVPYIKILTRFRVVLDAGWPLSDANDQSRFRVNRYLILLMNYLYDFLSFQLCDHLILESNAQLERVARNFRIRKDKLTVRLTGVNESAFRTVAPSRPVELSYESSQKEIILFRGKANPESGIGLIAELQDLLPTNFLLVVVTNVSLLVKNSLSTVLISRHVTNEELRWLYEHARISLGQLSRDSRLKHTIPHKAFESAYFGVPYLSPRTVVLDELFGDSNNYVCIDTLDKVSIIQAIKQTVENEAIFKSIKQKSHDEYLLKASQRVLREIFDATFKV